MDLILWFNVYYLLFFLVCFLGISIKIIDKFNFCVGLISQFLRNFTNAKIYRLNVVKHKISIGGFWGKVFLKGQYAGNF